MKKTLLQLFLYFSVQIETENYKLNHSYESQSRYFIKLGKICITFGIFYDQLWASTLRGHKIFRYFWLQLVRMKSSKRLCRRSLITFLLFEILLSITFFLFPLKSLLKIEDTSYHKNRTIFEESRAWFYSAVISSNAHPF